MREALVKRHKKQILLGIDSNLTLKDKIVRVNLQKKS